MKTGFEKFLECLNLYLELLNNPTINKVRIRIYGSVTLLNSAIVRVTNNFHNREWFSEVAISMSSEESDDYISDQGVCYGQVIYRISRAKVPGSFANFRGLTPYPRVQ